MKSIFPNEWVPVVDIFSLSFLGSFPICIVGEKLNSDQNKKTVPFQISLEQRVARVLRVVR